MNGMSTCEYPVRFKISVVVYIPDLIKKNLFFPFQFGIDSGKRDKK